MGSGKWKVGSGKRWAVEWYLAPWKSEGWHGLKNSIYGSDLRDFGFRDQITRAGLSVPSNIAEGHERESYKEMANFLS